MTDTDLIQVCSIDIGKKNFAFCIEEFDRALLLSLPNIQMKYRYKQDGTTTEQMQEILDKVFENGRTILYKNLDLTQNCNPKLKLDPETYHNMTDVLDQYVSYFDNCQVFVIEEQMSFGKKFNKMAMKLGQHCYSYFAFKYGRFKTIIEFPAYHKTQILGAPKVDSSKVQSRAKKNPKRLVKKRYKAMTKSQRKKWSVEKAYEILEQRGEYYITEEFDRDYKKLDDICDCICQLNAFKYKVYVDREI